MHTINTAVTDVLAAEATFDFSGIQNTVVRIVGSLLIIILVIRAAIAYAKRSWGELVSEVVFVLVIGWFVWFPTNAIETLKAITGGTTGAA